MSGADDLRTAFEYAAQCWYADGMVGGREYGELADALLAVVPNHPQAILNLIGDVREGHMILEGAMRTGQVMFYDTEWGVPGYWVRPRGEATE